LPRDWTTGDFLCSIQPADVDPSLLYLGRKREGRGKEVKKKRERGFLLLYQL